MALELSCAIIGALWIATGMWLTIAALPEVTRQILSEQGSVNYPLLALIIVLTVLWSPTRFIRALLLGKPA